MKVVLFAGAAIEDYGFCQAYLEGGTVICCDGGIAHAKALGITPRYIVGDFDSADPVLLEEYRNQGIDIKTYPTHKDETDMELGMDLAIELGATDLVIFGGIGSRFDHTLANAHLLLRLLKKGIRGRLVNENNCVELIDKSLTVTGKKGDIVSTIPLSMEVKGITLEGFAYPLTNKTLAIDDDIVAVSNVMLGETAKITITEGYLFVIQARD